MIPNGHGKSETGKPRVADEDLLQPLTKHRADGLTMALTGVAKYCHPKFSYKPEFTSQSELSSVDAPVPYSLYLPIYSVSPVYRTVDGGPHGFSPVAIEWKIYSECVPCANTSASSLTIRPPNSQLYWPSVHTAQFYSHSYALPPTTRSCVVIMNY